MCDLTTYVTVQHLCEHWIDRGDMFTAFDISLEAKRQGIPRRHRHMKHAVHDLYESGAMGPDYTRTLIAVPGVQAPAWLYHRWEDDISEYQTMNRSSFEETMPYRSRRTTLRERPRRRAAGIPSPRQPCPRCARASLSRSFLSRMLRWF